MSDDRDDDREPIDLDAIRDRLDLAWLATEIDRLRERCARAERVANAASNLDCRAAICRASDDLNQMLAPDIEGHPRARELVVRRRDALLALLDAIEYPETP